MPNAALDTILNNLKNAGIDALTTVITTNEAAVESKLTAEADEAVAAGEKYLLTLLPGGVAGAFIDPELKTLITDAATKLVASFPSAEEAIVAFALAQLALAKSYTITL